MPDATERIRQALHRTNRAFDDTARHSLGRWRAQLERLDTARRFGVSAMLGVRNARPIALRKFHDRLREAAEAGLPGDAFHDVQQAMTDVEEAIREDRRR